MNSFLKQYCPHSQETMTVKEQQLPQKFIIQGHQCYYCFQYKQMCIILTAYAGNFHSYI